MTLLNNSRDTERPMNSSWQNNIPEVTGLALNPDGSPMVLHPKGSMILFRIMRFILMYGVVQVILPSFILRSIYKKNISFQDIKGIYATVNAAHSSPITKNSTYQNPLLLSRLWKLPSAKIYVSSGALEYQKREGYCGRTTVRCLLKSFSIPHNTLPDAGTDASPETFCKSMQNAANSNKTKPLLKTQIIRGDVTYMEFVNIIRKTLDNPNFRLAVNYLRGPLFGFQRPKWMPMHIMHGMLIGHFSPIVGILERDEATDDPLVAIFDVNHNYGGAYLVPATKLYESIRAMDVFSMKHRALILAEVKKGGGGW